MVALDTSRIFVYTITIFQLIARERFGIFYLTTAPSCVILIYQLSFSSTFQCFNDPEILSLFLALLLLTNPQADIRGAFYSECLLSRVSNLSSSIAVVAITLQISFGLLSVSSVGSVCTLDGQSFSLEIHDGPLNQLLGILLAAHPLLPIFFSKQIFTDMTYKYTAPADTQLFALLKTVGCISIAT